MKLKSRSGSKHRSAAKSTEHMTPRKKASASKFEAVSRFKDNYNASDRQETLLDPDTHWVIDPDVEMEDDQANDDDNDSYDDYE